MGSAAKEETEYELFRDQNDVSNAATFSAGRYELSALVLVTADYDGDHQVLHSRWWDASGTLPCVHFLCAAHARASKNCHSIFRDASSGKIVSYSTV